MSEGRKEWDGEKKWSDREDSLAARRKATIRPAIPGLNGLGLWLRVTQHGEWHAWLGLVIRFYREAAYLVRHRNLSL